MTSKIQITSKIQMTNKIQMTSKIHMANKQKAPFYESKTILKKTYSKWIIIEILTGILSLSLKSLSCC